ncbi:hypothetical protein Avbf_03598 [Armadillidium vulgare]|nr:hypothetical protein Avbf_03598 [Armadillidium vulgare]
MLAGEKLFKKGEDREYKKNFCFKMAKKYLPLDMQLLFTKSFSEEDLNVLVSELALSGEFLDDLYLLQTRYRKDMYNMSGRKLEDSESCRLLPREVQIPCNLHAERIRVGLNETEEMPLIWLGSKSLNPLKAFLIRKAQETCNANNEFDLIRISRFKSPPNSFWINSLIKIDTLYGDAWHCASNSSMAQTRECPPESTTTGWTPITRTSINK